MGKKFEQQPPGMPPTGGQTLSREDRKNAHIMRMFQKQERQRLRKEERKSNKQSVGGDFEKPQGVRTTGNTSTNVSSHKPVHRSSGFATSRHLPGHSSITQNHHHERHERHKHRVNNSLPGYGQHSTSSKKKPEGNVPPIEVHFADNVARKPNNLYFFRRKSSFEERQKVAQERQYQVALMAQQQAIKAASQFQMADKTGFMGSQQQNQQGQTMSNAQIHHELQQQQFQQAYMAVQSHNQGNLHVNSGLPRAAISALAAPQHGFITAGTGGMYDPIMSGGESSISSASKNSVGTSMTKQQHHVINQNQMRPPDFECRDSAVNPMNLIPRPNLLMAHSAPHMRAGNQSGHPSIYPHQLNSAAAASMIPSGAGAAFAHSPDSSEIESSSESVQGQGVPTNQAMLLQAVHPHIPPHLLQTGAPPQAQLMLHQQNSSNIQQVPAVEKPNTEVQRPQQQSSDEEDMKLILERTREAQRALKNKGGLLQHNKNPQKDPDKST